MPCLTTLRLNSFGGCQLEAVNLPARSAQPSRHGLKQLLHLHGSYMRSRSWDDKALRRACFRSTLPHTAPRLPSVHGFVPLFLTERELFVRARRLHGLLDEDLLTAARDTLLDVVHRPSSGVHNIQHRKSQNASWARAWQILRRSPSNPAALVSWRKRQREPEMMHDG